MRQRSAHTPFSLFSFQDIITSVMGVMILVLLVVAIEMINRQLQVPAIVHTQTADLTDAALDDARSRLQELKQAAAEDLSGEKLSMSAQVLAQNVSDLEQTIASTSKELAQARQRAFALQQRLRASEKDFADRAAERAELARMEQSITEMSAEIEQLASSKQLLFRLAQRGRQQPWLVQIDDREILAAPLGPRLAPQSFKQESPRERRRRFSTWAKQQDRGEIYFILMVKPGGAAIGREIESELRSAGFGVGLDLIGPDTTVVDPVDGSPCETSPTGDKP